MSESLTSLTLETPSDEVFIAAADRFGKLAYRENVTADHPVPYLKSRLVIKSGLFRFIEWYIFKPCNLARQSNRTCHKWRAEKLVCR